MIVDGWGREISETIFDDIIGYDDVKQYFWTALRSPKKNATMLIGPPASAKSMFLEALESIGMRMLSGANLGSAGLAEVLAEERPKIVGIDEAEKIKRAKDLAPLLTWVESGRVMINTKGKNINAKIDSNKWMVILACNSTNLFTSELMNRFMPFQFKKYTQDQFYEVAVKILVNKHGCTTQFAKEITWRLIDEHCLEVRTAIQLADLCVYTSNPQKTLMDIMTTRSKYKYIHA